MGRRKGITAIVGFVLLAIVVTLVVDLENTQSQNKDVIKHDYTFTGESENWSAAFEVEGEEVFYEEEEVMKRDRDVQSEFKLTYKGSLDELSSVKELSYGYKTSKSASEVNRTFEDAPLDEKVFTLTGSTLVREDRTIEIFVEWDDQAETFILEATE